MNRLWAAAGLLAVLITICTFGSHFHPIYYNFYHTRYYTNCRYFCKMIKIQRLHSADRQEKNGKITMWYCVHSCPHMQLEEIDGSLAALPAL